jgi:hypothetical protein
VTVGPRLRALAASTVEFRTGAVLGADASGAGVSTASGTAAAAGSAAARATASTAAESGIACAMVSAPSTIFASAAASLRDDGGHADPVSNVGSRGLPPPSSRHSSACSAMSTSHMSRAIA